MPRGALDGALRQGGLDGRLEAGWRQAGGRLEAGWRQAGGSGGRLEAGWMQAGSRLEAGWRQAGGKLGPGWSQISLFGQHFRRCGYTWHSSVAKLEAKTVPRAGAAESRPRVKLLVHLCKQN